MVMNKLKKKTTHSYQLNPAFFIELRLVKPMLHSNTSWNVNFFESFFYPIVSYSNVSLFQMMLLRILHKTWASGTCSCSNSTLSVSV